MKLRTILTTAAAVFVASRVRRAVALGRPVLHPPAPEPLDAEERIAVAASYISSLIGEYDPYAVRYARDCRRVENGLPTGFGYRHMQIDAAVGLQYSFIRAAGPFEWEVDPQDAPAGTVRVRFPVVGGIGPLSLIRVHVTDDFVVPAEDGLIHSIRVTIGRSV